MEYNLGVEKATICDDEEHFAYPLKLWYGSENICVKVLKVPTIFDLKLNNFAKNLWYQLQNGQMQWTSERQEEFLNHLLLQLECKYTSKKLDSQTSCKGDIKIKKFYRLDEALLNVDSNQHLVHLSEGNVYRISIQEVLRQIKGIVLWKYSEGQYPIHFTVRASLFYGGPRGSWHLFGHTGLHSNTTKVIFDNIHHGGSN